MKKLTCDICGNTDLIKQDGFFMCQTCGTKYSVEEAKKMMIDGTVEIQDTMRLDSSEKIEKLYQAARNARKVSDDATALKHYESISAQDPNSWEALFYLVILKTNSITNGEITSAANNVALSIEPVFQLINEYVPEETNKKAAVKEVIEQCYITATWLTSASHNFRNSLKKGSGIMALAGLSGMVSSFVSNTNANREDQLRCCEIAMLMRHCGNAIASYFDMEDEDYREYAIWSWKKMLEFNNDFKKSYNLNIFNDKFLEEFSCTIQEFEYGNKKISNNDVLKETYYIYPTENTNMDIIKDEPTSSTSPSKLPKVFGIISIILGGLSLLWAWIFVIIGYFLAGGGLALSLIGLIKNKRIYVPNDKTVTCKIGLILSSVGLHFSSISSICLFASDMAGLISLF